MCCIILVCVCGCTTIYIDDYYMYFIIFMLDIGERAFEFMFLVVMPYR